MSATPEDAVRAMQELTAAVKENTRISSQVGQQLFILNQIITKTNQGKLGAALLGAIVKSAAQMFARGA